MALNQYHFTFDPRKKGLRKILGDLAPRGDAFVHGRAVRGGREQVAPGAE